MIVDHFIGMVFLMLLMINLMCSGIFLFGDFRNFNSIKKECERQNYIQNNKYRIYCSVENE